jgi:hypothetical protein
MHSNWRDADIYPLQNNGLLCRYPPGYSSIKEPTPKVPLIKTVCTGSVCDGVGEFTVEQVFKNHKNHNLLEARLVILLPKSASIDKVTLKIGDRELESVLTKKEEARRKYDQAIENKNKAMLLEKNDVGYYIKMGNIEKNETVIVTYRYSLEMDYVDGEYRGAIPCTTAPSYDPTKNRLRVESKDDAADNDGIGEDDQEQPKEDVIEIPYSNKSETEFLVNITIKCTANTGIKGMPSNIIESIESPSHPIDCDIKKISPTEYKVTMHTIGLTKDFTLSYKTKETHGMQFYRDDKKGYVYGRVYFKLDPIKMNIAPNKITNILCIDRSGSMGGNKIIIAKELATLAFNTFLSELEGSRFNILSFGDNHEMMYPGKGIVLDEKINKMEQINKIRGIEADMGGTELLNAVESLINMDIKDGEFVNVCVLTDGDVSNKDEVTTMIRVKKNPRIRFSVIGVGDSASRSLCEGMATAGGGRSTIVVDVSKSKIKQSFINHFKISLLENCYNANLSFDNKYTVYTYDGLTHIVPNCSYSIYTRTPISEFKGTSTATFTYTVASTGKVEEKKFVLNNFNQNNLIEKLFAGKMIANIQQGYNPYNIDLEKLSLEYGIMSNKTSFIVVDKTKQVEGDLETVDVPHYSEGAATPMSVRGGAVRAMGIYTTASVTSRRKSAIDREEKLSISHPSDLPDEEDDSQGDCEEKGLKGVSPMIDKEEPVEIMTDTIDILQKADGSFEMSKAVLDILKTTEKELKELAKQKKKDVMIIFHEAIIKYLTALPEYEFILKKFNKYLQNMKKTEQSGNKAKGKDEVKSKGKGKAKDKAEDRAKSKDKAADRAKSKDKAEDKPDDKSKKKTTKKRTRSVDKPALVAGSQASYRDKLRKTAK